MVLKGNRLEQHCLFHVHPRCIAGQRTFIETSYWAQIQGSQLLYEDCATNVRICFPTPQSTNIQLDHHDTLTKHGNGSARPIGFTLMKWAFVSDRLTVKTEPYFKVTFQASGFQRDLGEWKRIFIASTGLPYIGHLTMQLLGLHPFHATSNTTPAILKSGYRDTLDSVNLCGEKFEGVAGPTSQCSFR